jgi:predicted nucleotidyltransferase
MPTGSISRKMGTVPNYLQQELQHLLGCNVDLVRMRDNMNALLKQRIQKEAYYV